MSLAMYLAISWAIIVFGVFLGATILGAKVYDDNCPYCMSEHIEFMRHDMAMCRDCGVEFPCRR